MLILITTCCCFNTETFFTTLNIMQEVQWHNSQWGCFFTWRSTSWPDYGCVQLVSFRQFCSNSCLSYSPSEAEIEDQPKDPRSSRRSGPSSTSLSPHPCSITSKLHLDPCQHQRRPPQGIVAMGVAPSHPFLTRNKTTKDARQSTTKATTAMALGTLASSPFPPLATPSLAIPSAHQSLSLPFLHSPDRSSRFSIPAPITKDSRRRKWVREVGNWSQWMNW